MLAKVANSFWSVLQLLRPLNLVLGALAIIISAAILGTIDRTAALIMAVLVVVTLNAAANAFNDYMDFEADKFNRPNRPLPQGKLPSTAALWIAMILFAIGVVISYLINREAFVIAAFIAVPLMVTYSLWFKGWPLIGNIVVSLILGLAFIFAGAAFGNLWGLLVPALLAFGFTLIRELVKDVADMEGDRAANLNTYPIRFGMHRAIQLIAVFILLLCVGALVPYWLGIFGIHGHAYLVVLILGIEIPLLFVLFMIMKSPSISTCRLTAQILKACIFAGLLAVFLGFGGLSGILE